MIGLKYRLQIRVRVTVTFFTGMCSTTDHMITSPWGRVYMKAKSDLLFTQAAELAIKLRVGEKDRKG